MVSLFWLLSRLDILFLLPFSTFWSTEGTLAYFLPWIYSFTYDFHFFPIGFWYGEKSTFFVPRLRLKLEILSATFCPFDFEACHCSELQFVIWTMGILVLSILPTSQEWERMKGVGIISQQKEQREFKLLLSSWKRTLQLGRTEDRPKRGEATVAQGYPESPCLLAPGSPSCQALLLGSLQTTVAVVLVAEQLRIRRRQEWHK